MNKAINKEKGGLMRFGKLSVLLCLLGFAIFFNAYSCSGKSSVMDDAKKYYNNGKYKDAIFVIKHYMRRGGEGTPGLFFIEGSSYLKLGMESQAIESFRSCYESDTTWAEKIAETIREEAVREFERGNYLKARRMAEQAVGFVPGIEFGRYDAIVGNLLLDKKMDDLAADYFERYIRNYPDTSGLSKVMFNLATAYANTGDTVRAVDVCREIINKYPKSTVKSNAKWMLENMLYARAESAFNSGEYDVSKLMLNEIIAETTNPVMKEKVYFLLGSAYEKMAEYKSAVRCYREVINLNLGSSSRLLEKAKERIEKLEATGE